MDQTLIHVNKWKLPLCWWNITCYYTVQLLYELNMAVTCISQPLKHKQTSTAIIVNNCVFFLAHWFRSFWITTEVYLLTVCRIHWWDKRVNAVFIALYCLAVHRSLSLYDNVPNFLSLADCPHCQVCFFSRNNRPLSQLFPQIWDLSLYHCAAAFPIKGHRRLSP